MKDVLMFMMKSCPYCQQALRWMEKLRDQDPRYNNLTIKIIDENLQPDLAKQYDYYLVPTFYVDGVKVHEGAATHDIIKNVFEKALG